MDGRLRTTVNQNVEPDGTSHVTVIGNHLNSYLQRTHRRAGADLNQASPPPKYRSTQLHRWRRRSAFGCAAQAYGLAGPRIQLS